MFLFSIMIYTLVIFVTTIYLTKEYDLADNYWYTTIVELAQYAYDFIDRGARGFMYR